MFRWFKPKLYNSIGQTLRSPAKVKHLWLQAFEKDLNQYASDFSRLVNLQSLDIHTSIGHPAFLPSEIGSLSQLIGSLSQLKRVKILNVLFEEFPEWILQLTNLEHLYIRGCEITSLPDAIANLTNSKELRIENCSLTALPYTLNQLTDLKTLSVIITPLETVPISVLPLSLKTLDVSFTPLCQDKPRLQKLITELPGVRVLYPPGPLFPLP